MLEAYYNTRGWDPVTGFPSEEKISQLGLDWVLDDLNASKPRAIQ